ncbi:MBG domain-containing protein [Mucilaginibacter celer]|uniref:T9SS C-terminal target domain-containing protein n=1 Tax=Mucilaginibacter celer TaxID=2305508 RepID=A0A494VR18_9SPHI|nr:MBG domain-containing protein [Mucilaginibacter celer]AYL96471.1 T9SS C-terminal target domain-containing protein [Mucilaginibacter celer]
MKCKLLLLLIWPMLIGAKLLAAPVISSFNPASGPVGTLVTVTGSDLNSPTAFTIGGVPAIVISNTGTQLVGMVMPGATTGNVSITTAGGSATGAGSFTIVATPVPTTQQNNKFVRNGATDFVAFGCSIAISADGTTAVVGGFNDNKLPNNYGVGAIWVFVRNGDTWTQQGGKLVGTGGLGGINQGWSVAISADGNTIIEGGPIDNGNRGAAWVFTRSGGVWTQQGAKLVATGGTGASQVGTAVAISADGNTALLGGSNDNGQNGATWVFTRSGGSWTQQGNKLFGTGGAAGSRQGSVLAISADGRVALTGGSSSWIFILNNGVWTQAARLSGAVSVALSADGSTAILGVPGYNNGIGNALVYARNGNNWLSQSQIVPPFMVGKSSAGESVGLSADGNSAVIGGPFDDSRKGAIWVYTRSGTTWAIKGGKLTGTGGVGNSGLGTNSALSADGSTIVSTGGGDNSDIGAVWPFKVGIPQTITFSPLRNATYGAADITPVATSTNSSIPITFTSSDTTVAVILNNKIHIKAVGTTVIRAFQDGDFTYAAATPYPRGFTVDAAPLTIRPDNKTVEQGQPIPALTATFTGFVNGETTTVLTTQPTISTTGNSSSPVGTYPITASGAVAKNYAITYNPGQLTITEPTSTQTITFNSINGADYGKPDIAPGATSTNPNNPITYSSSDTTVATIVNNKIHIIGAGTTNITASQAGDATHSPATPVTRPFVVSKVVLTATADNKKGISTHPLPVFTATYTGFVNGETNSVFTTQPTFTTTATTSSPVGTYPITMSGAVARNYLINNYVQGILTLTSSSPPTISSVTPASTPIGGLITINGTNLDYASSFKVGGINGVIVSATSTRVVGMVMPGTVNGTVTVNTLAGAATSSTTFTVAANLVPNAQQGNKLVGTGNSGPALQGSSIAASSDGNTLVVGGSYDNNGMGATWIFTRSGTTWSQQGGKLIGTGATGPNQLMQGRSVAVSADGNTIIVGGPGDSANVGAAWIFTRTGSTWSQQGTKLVGAGSVGPAQMGASVALSADGNTALIGGFNDNNGVGATWVFIRQNGVWSQQGNKLTGNDAYVTAGQGLHVAISANGNTAVVGGPNDFNGMGAAWVFIRTGTTWAQQGSKLLGADRSGSTTYQGNVAISADGNTILSGGYGDANYQGATWVFTRTGTTWSQLGSKLVGSGGVTQDFQGSSVAISADGLTAVIGGTGSSTSRGATWVFTRSGNTFGQHQAERIGSNSTNGARQGAAVAIAANGRTIYAAGPNDNNNQGAVWAFIPAAKQSQSIDFAPLAAVDYGTQFVTPVYQSTNTTLPITLTSSDSTIAVIAGNGKIHPRKGGTVTITATQPGDSKFSDAVPVSQVLTINKIPLTVFATNKTVSEGFSTLNLTGTYQGFVNGDSTSSFTKQPVFSTTATGTSAPGDYPITASGAVSASYTFTYKPGTLTVIPKQGPPQIASFSPKTGAVGTLVTITGSNLYAPAAFTIGGKPAIVISNTGSKLVGMVMPGAVNGPVSLSTDSGSTSTPVNFIVKATSYPSIQQGGALTGTGNIGAATQGYAVALSADGNTALVGARDDNGGQGAAWIFVRSGAVWQQQGSKLVGTGGSGQVNQGSAVAISADGNTAVVGGPADNGNVGAAWVFVRVGNTWQQQGDKLAGTGNIGESRQGQSIALSADGNTVVLGAAGDNNNLGAVWTFRRVSGVWQQINKVVVTDNILQPGVGRSVAISADGNTLLAGGPADNGGVGAVWIFKRVGNYWQQQRKLIGTVQGGAQGFSVSINADGTETFVGSYDYYPNEPENGYPADYTSIVTDYKLVNGDWLQQAKNYTFFNHTYLTNLIGAAPSADAKTFLVAGAVENSTAPQSVQVVNGSTQFELVANNTTATSMALSADGSTAILGFGYEGPTGLIRAFVSAEKNSQLITFNQPGPFTYGAPDTLISATSTNSSLPIMFTSSDTTVATIVAGNKVHILKAGVTNITASQDDASITPVTQAVTIKKALAVFTADAKSKAIGEPIPELTGIYSGFKNGDNSSVVTTQPVITTKATVNSLPGQYLIIGSGAAAANYDFRYVGGVMTVTNGTLPVISSFTPKDISAGATITINGANFDHATAVSFGGVPATSFTIVSSSRITAIVANGATGDVKVTTTEGVATLEGATFKQSQTITFAQPTARYVGDADFDPGATSSSGLPVSYTSNNTAIATIVNNKVHIVAQGSVSIGAAQAGDATYAPAANVYRTLVIRPMASFASSFAEFNALNDKKNIPYPNPFQTMVNFNLGDVAVSNVKVEVNNLSNGGTLTFSNQYVNKQGVLQLNLGSLRNGVYVLRITADNQVKEFKIVKNTN